MTKVTARLQLAFAIAFSLSGCTLIGRSIGARIDRGKPLQHKPVARGEIDTLKVGEAIEIQLWDGRRLSGKYQGLEWAPPQTYGPRYEEARTMLEPELRLPALGPGARRRLYGRRDGDGGLPGSRPRVLALHRAWAAGDHGQDASDRHACGRERARRERSRPGEAACGAPPPDADRSHDRDRDRQPGGGPRPGGGRQPPRQAGLGKDDGPGDRARTRRCGGRDGRSGRHRRLQLQHLLYVVLQLLPSRLQLRRPRVGPRRRAARRGVLPRRGTNRRGPPRAHRGDGRALPDSDPERSAGDRPPGRGGLARGRSSPRNRDRSRRARTASRRARYAGAHGGRRRTLLGRRPADWVRRGARRGGRRQRLGQRLAGTRPVAARRPARRDRAVVPRGRPAPPPRCWSPVSARPPSGPVCWPRCWPCRAASWALFYASLEANPAAREAFERAREREVLPTVRVFDGTAWRVAGYLRDLPSMVHREQAVPLDLRGVDGGTLRLRIDGAPGLFSIDRAVVSFDVEPEVTETRVPGGTRRQTTRDATCSTCCTERTAAVTRCGLRRDTRDARLPGAPPAGRAGAHGAGGSDRLLQRDRAPGG